jgi:hypothetical protein
MKKNIQKYLKLDPFKYLVHIIFMFPSLSFSLSLFFLYLR